MSTNRGESGDKDERIRLLFAHGFNPYVDKNSFIFLINMFKHFSSKSDVGVNFKILFYKLST